MIACFEGFKYCAPVAQGIERRFPKPCVGCSNHLGSANKKAIGFMSIVFLFVSDRGDSNIRRDRAWGRISSPLELHSIFSIYVNASNATNYSFGGDRHTKYVTNRGLRPLWSTLCVPEVVRIISGVPKKTLQFKDCRVSNFLTIIHFSLFEPVLSPPCRHLLFSSLRQLLNKPL